MKMLRYISLILIFSTIQQLKADLTNIDTIISTKTQRDVPAVAIPPSLQPIFDKTFNFETSLTSALQSLLTPIISLQPVPYPPETLMLTDEVISYRNFTLEIHYVTTADGYILKMHRIPCGKVDPDKTCNANNIGKPVLLMHGLGVSSFQWFINNETQSLGFLLAELGYDVWVGDFRGNVYSTNHTNLNTSSAAFWNFSWDQMAEHDLPTFIDYILTKTSQQKLYYIGHSMGTTVFYAMSGYNPDYYNKIKLAITLAPVVFFNNTSSPTQLLAPHWKVIYSTFQASGQYQYSAKNDKFNEIAGRLCPIPLLSNVCNTYSNYNSGIDLTGLDSSRMGVYLAHASCGTSLMSAMHFFQEMNLNNNAIFQKYDFLDKNVEVYNQATPPAYDLSKVKAPVALIYGDADQYAVEKNVIILSKRLPQVVFIGKVNRTGFTHNDFCLAKDTYANVNVKVVDLLNSN